MLQVPTKIQSVHPPIISVLSRLRQEWQEATDGISLVEVNGNIGLMLADLVNGFQLSTEEQNQVLGKQLFDELSDFLYAPKQN